MHEGTQLIHLRAVPGQNEHYVVSRHEEASRTDYVVDPLLGNQSPDEQDP